MASSSDITRYYADHRWCVIGGLAAAAAAVVGFFQLRKSPVVPSITIAAPASSGAPSGFSPSDILGAYGAGSAATAAGAAPLVGLGQGGLDLASSALAAESSTLQALGGTQASMGGSLSDLLKTVFSQQPVATANPVSPTPTPTPTPTPPPTPPPPPSGPTPPGTVTLNASHWGYRLDIGQRVGPYPAGTTWPVFGSVFANGVDAWLVQIPGVPGWSAIGKTGGTYSGS